MELIWVSPGQDKDMSESLKQKITDWTPLFLCFSQRCNGAWDNEPLDPKYYEYLLWGEGFDFEKAQKEMPPEEFEEIKQEIAEMKRLFLERPYLAIPQMY